MKLQKIKSLIQLILWWNTFFFFFKGKPPSVNAWMAQCCLYLILMAIVKISITLFMQLDFWDEVKDFILSPIYNPKLELVIVMLIIPFIVNVSIICLEYSQLLYRSF